MAEQLTPKERAFAIAYGLPDEHGRWRTFAEAYRLVYDVLNIESKHHRSRGYEVANKPKVAAFIKALKDEHFEDLERRAIGGIAVQSQRIIEKQKRHILLNALLADRAQVEEGMARRIRDLEHEILNCDNDEAKKDLQDRLDLLFTQFLPGEDTGLLARDYKQVGTRTFPVGRLDKALLDALNDLENDVAKELGQLVDKKDITSGGQPIKALIGVNIEDI